MGRVTDDELLARMLDEPDLVGILYERHAQAVFRYFARRVAGQVAEDLTADVFGEPDDSAPPLSQK